MVMPGPRPLVRRKLLILASAVLVGVIAAEVAVRGLQPVPAADLLPFPYNHADLGRLAANEAYVQFDSELGWTTGRGVSRRDDGVAYSANAGGFRADREYAGDPPPATPRVAAFGDSFTHCDEVNYRDCWTARLEAAWDGAEVLNFGIPASAPDQGWLRYRRDARPYRPCAVLIGFQVENVNRVVNRFRPFYTPASGVVLSKPRYVLDGDGLRLVPNPVTRPGQLADPAWAEQTLGPDDFWYFPGMFAPARTDGLMLARLARTASYWRHRAAISGAAAPARPNGRAYDVQDERFQVSGRVLIQFAREVAADGATPFVLFFGQKGEVIRARHGDPKEYQPLLDWLRAEAIVTIDITDDLAREANRTGVDPLFASGGHYSRRGNEVVGAALARRLPQLASPTCP